MKINRLSQFLAALALIILSPAKGYAAEPVLWETFENWKVYLSTTAGGDFDLCMATRTYHNEEMLVFYVDAKTSALGLFIEDWKLDARDRYPVHLQFDGGPLIETVAIADETKESVLFDLNLSQHIQALTKAATMTLHTGAGALNYDLTGAEEAIKSAAICAVNNAPPGSLEE